MQTQRKNMERMAEVVPGSGDQALQHFLTNSPWNEREVLDQVALEADRLIGGEEGSALLVDESGITKKGKHSVGVSRQWNGRLGKVDNCQVGVYATLCRGPHATLVDARLYLPDNWVQDPKRCQKAGIPEDRRTLKSKPQMALEMIRYNRRLGVRFFWVGMDGFYGNDPDLLRSLDSDGEVFMADIHKDQRIYLEDPQPSVPEAKPGRGRNKTCRVSRVSPIRVDKWMEDQSSTAWKRVGLRESTKGFLDVEVLHRCVWVWDGKEEHAHQWHLLVRREINAPGEIKYSLSNARNDISIERLAHMQGQRYWVERSFQDGKSHVGLDHYQARSWRSWHHHMALVMMAMLFMLEERLLHKRTYPLLSCSDIETLLARFLPRRDIDLDEVVRQMENRHKKRQHSIDHAYHKQGIAQAGMSG
ncbi:MAG: IS701 family transposase [Magnetococcales bacterium]|nr:IS701 family transposase [Magnetococcales bacterium]